MKRIVLIALFLLMPLEAAKAEGRLISAGVPDKPVSPRITEQNQIDLWTRQLQYRKERLKFRQILADRQQNFASARRQGYNRYEQSLAAMNASRTDWQGETQ